MRPQGAYGFLIGSMLGFLAIVFGAFEAHAQEQAVARYAPCSKRASRYQMYHPFLKFVLDVVVVQPLG
jgi:uncharacterized membrane protein YgdD (TMEM256/DUF423 family)